MLITICIGSSCHLKGSRSVIQGLEKKSGKIIWLPKLN